METDMPNIIKIIIGRYRRWKNQRIKRRRLKQIKKEDPHIYE